MFDALSTFDQDNCNYVFSSANLRTELGHHRD